MGAGRRWHVGRGGVLEKVLEKFNMKPNSEQLESARLLLEKDYAYGLERLQTSPLSERLAPSSKIINVDYYNGDTIVVHT